MNNQVDEFLAEGMKRYKQATAVMVSFQNETETRLRDILASRSAEEWGSFKAEKMVKAKQHRNWQEFPTLYGGIDGKVGGTAVRIWMAVDWYDSETNYPYYFAKLETQDDLQNALRNFLSNHDTNQYRGWRGVPELRLDPDEKDFNLERDFNKLLNELTRFFNEQVK